MAPYVGLSTVKRFLDISAPLKMDPEVEYLIQQMHPVKGGQVRFSADFVRYYELFRIFYN
jgi:hypothetical protein